MKRIAVFGGTGGLGIKLVPLLEKRYEVVSIGSKLVDVTELNQVKKFFDNNDIDIVLNMSAKTYDIHLSRINEGNHQAVTDMLDVNIIGNINILASCLPKMIEKKYGRVISMSSVTSELNVPTASLYCASKAFLDRLMSNANKENVRYGITCNTIRLGYWDGGMCERITPDFREVIRKSISLRRWGKMEELYNTINYIVENEYVCGTNLKIDGGI